MKTTNTLQKAPFCSSSQPKEIESKYSQLKMQKLKIVFIVTMLIATVSFTSCDKDDDSTIDVLVGTWMFEENIDGTLTLEWLTFYSDNTGTITIKTTENDITDLAKLEFTYSTFENQLNVNIENETISISYDISENKLTINEEGDTSVYTKVKQSGGSGMNVSIL